MPLRSLIEEYVAKFTAELNIVLKKAEHVMLCGFHRSALFFKENKFCNYCLQ